MYSYQHMSRLARRCLLLQDGKKRKGGSPVSVFSASYPILRSRLFILNAAGCQHPVGPLEACSINDSISLIDPFLDLS
jgi:hypothetical protein